MDDLQMRGTGANDDLYTPEIDGLTEADAQEFKAILGRFVGAYKQKNPDTPIAEWLAGQFKTEMPDISEEDAERLSQETVATIEEYDKNLKDLKAATEKGHSKERWMADKLQEASIGMAVAEYGKWLTEIDSTLQIGNEAMKQVILRLDGEVNKNLYLDGFIAEQAHVNRFNALAVIESEPYRAEVCVPDGVYGKNSFDVVIKDKSGKIVHQYQMKYGSTAQKTIQRIKEGNYNNQILVVPADQVAEVQAAFPGKTVVSAIGGKDIRISSANLTKEEVKALQKEAQEKGIIPTDSFWNTYTTKQKALLIGTGAVVSGIQGAIVGVGFSLAAKLFDGEEADPDETIQTALESGVDAGIKAATTGAIVVASSAGGPLCNIIPKGTAIGILANIACVAVENIKILGKVTIRDLTLTEGLDQMGQTSTAMYCGLICMTGGTGIGVAALSWLPVIGPVIGGLVGGALGYMGGSHLGETIYRGAKQLIKTGASFAKKTVDSLRNTVGGVKDFVFSLLW